MLGIVIVPIHVTMPIHDARAKLNKNGTNWQTTMEQAPTQTGLAFLALQLAVAAYVTVSARNRQIGSTAYVWGLAALVFGLFVVPFFRAFRPLKATEVREGGRFYIVLRDFARLIILGLIAFGLTSCLLATEGSEQLTEAGQAGRIMGGWMINLCLLPIGLIVWVVPRMFRSDAKVEGPTGPLAESNE